MSDIMKRSFAVIRRYPLIWRLLVLALLFTVLLYNVRPHEIIEAIRHARPYYLCIALLLLIPNLALQVIKWDVILGTSDPKPSLVNTIRSLFAGFFLGAVSPARTGELARGLVLPGHSKLKIASLTVLDKGFNHATTYTAAFIALMLALPMPLKLVPMAAQIALIVAACNITRLRPALERFFHRFSQQTTVDNALAAFDALSRRTVLTMIGLSIAFFVTFTVQFYFIILCFTDLDWLTAVKTIPLIYAINLVMPITIGDLGVKEMASVKLLGPFGIPGGAAFSASITQNVMTFIIPSLAGGIILALAHPRKRTTVHASDPHTAPSSE